MNAAIELRELQHVLLLVEEMNFSRAALRANLSQTAFSRSIQGIEQRYGLSLFDRSTRRVAPTAACRQLLARAQDLVAKAAELSRDMQHLAGALGGLLRFGCSPLAVDCFVRGVLPQLLQQSPQAQLHIEGGQWAQLVRHLEAERIEFFVAYPGALAADPRYQVSALPAQAASVFVRASHPMAHRQQGLNLADLLPFPWAAVQFAEPIAEQIRQLCGLSRLSDLPIAMQCEHKDLLLDATLHSDQVLFTWQAWVVASVAQGQLVDLRPALQAHTPEAMFHLPCAIVRLADRTLSPLARTMVQLIERRAAEQNKGLAPGAESTSRS